MKPITTIQPTPETVSDLTDATETVLAEDYELLIWRGNHWHRVTQAIIDHERRQVRLA